MTNEVLQKTASDEQNVSSSNGLEPSLRFTGFYENWHEKYIKDVADVIGGGTPDTTKLEYWNGNIQWFTPTEIGHNKYVNKSKRTITEKGLKNSSAKLLPPKTILLTSRATIGECSIIEKECATNQGFQSLVPNSLINNEFCYYLINTKKKELLRKASGSTFLEISNSEIKQIKCKFPSLLEQQKIADFLFLVDRRIEKQRQLVESLKKYKRGLVFHLFNKNNPINKSIPMRDLLTEINDRNSVGLRVCSVAVIKGIVDQIEHLGRSFSASDTSKYRRVHFGDVVYTKSPTGDFPFGIVKQSKIKEDVAVSPLYGVYKPSSYSTGNLLHLYFEQYQYANNYIRSLAQKGAKNTINITTQHFLEKNIIFPYNEVDRVYFSNFFEKLNKLIKFNEGELEKAQSLKKGLLQQMFI